MNPRLGWFNILVITTISGLIVRIVGDPLVQMTSPRMQSFFESLGGLETVEAWIDDTQNILREKWEEWSDRSSSP